ncbi:MAG: hypothetical protein AAF497_13475, partial [Planctomycetota bacterium]
MELNVSEGTTAIANGPFAVIRNVTGVTLDGSSSVDGSSSGLTYNWSMATPTAVLGSTNATWDLPASAFDGIDAGEYTVTLTVRDSHGNEDVTTTTINVFDESVAISGTEENDVTFRRQDFGEGYESIRIATLPTSGTLYFDGDAVELGDEMTSHEIHAGMLVYVPEPDVSGVDVDSFQYDILANGTGYLDSVEATISLVGTADTPVVTSAITNEDSPNASGLVVNISAVDGPEVTHFRITNIQDGTLALQDGTSVNEGDFITVSEGNSGLVFTPDADFNGTTTFDVEASTKGDSSDLSPATTATVTVNPVNDAPVMDGLANVSLSDVLANSSNPIGVTVEELISQVTISDIDGTVSHGVALVGNDSTNGTWQFSLDDGSTWNTIDLDALSDSSAIVLDQMARVRFIPDAGFHGMTDSLNFRAWDLSDGAASGDVVDASSFGGTSAYSSNTGGMRLEVIPSQSLSISLPADQVIDTDTVFEFLSGTATEIT